MENFVAYLRWLYYNKFRGVSKGIFEPNWYASTYAHQAIKGDMRDGYID